MTEAFRGIYDESLDSFYNKEVNRVTPSKATTRKTLDPIPIFPTKKVWSGPIVSREKLVETLNAMEPEGYVIFTILTISIGQVQIVCYQEIEV